MMPEARALPLPVRHLRTLLVLAGLGAAGTLAGLWLAPDLTWAGVLIAAVLLTSLALAGPVFLSFLLLARAHWARPFLGTLLRLGRTLPVAAGSALILLLGLGLLYPWTHEAGHGHGDPTRGGWYSIPAFVLRMGAVFLLWFFFQRRLFQAVEARLEAQESPFRGDVQRRAALFLAVFAPTFSLFCFDSLLSLEPHWYSTIFAVYHLAGLACAGLAAGILYLLYRESLGLASGLDADRLQDLGRLLFCFTLFWVYCWYCQKMLIWYTDIPEEVAWFVRRQEGQWPHVVRASLILQWAVPFVFLLGRSACRNRKVVGRVALVVFLGHLVDLWVHAVPPVRPGFPAGAAWGLAPVTAGLALWVRFLLAQESRGRGPVPAALRPA